MAFRIIRDDITRVKADAIVNTANREPVFAGGTDAAVYQAAGAEALLAERKKIGFMREGEAHATPAFALPANYVIHTVSPFWVDGAKGERETLRQCYDNSLRLAVELGCASVAFPLLGAGVCGFPKREAVQIALSVFRQFLAESDKEEWSGQGIGDRVKTGNSDSNPSAEDSDPENSDVNVSAEDSDPESSDVNVCAEDSDPENSDVNVCAEKSDLEIILVVFGREAVEATGSLHEGLEAYIDDHFVEKRLKEEYRMDGAGVPDPGGSRSVEGMGAPLEASFVRPSEGAGVPRQMYSARQPESNHQRTEEEKPLPQEGIPARQSRGGMLHSYAEKAGELFSQSFFKRGVRNSAEGSVPRRKSEEAKGRSALKKDSDVMKESDLMEGSNIMEESDFEECSGSGENPSPMEDVLPMMGQAARSQAIQPMAAMAAMPFPEPAGKRRSLEDLVSQVAESWQESLFRLIDQKGYTDSEVYKRANVDRKLFSKIRNNTAYQPKKNTAVALAIALRLNLDETKDFLARAGYALSTSSKSDIIVEYFIEEGIYDIYEIEMALFEHELPLLGA